MPLFAPIRRVYTLARRAYGPFQWHIAFLFVLGFVSALFETIGINALIPLLSFVLEEGGEAQDTVSLAIRNLFLFFGIDFSPKFLLAFFTLLFVGKALFMMLFEWMRARVAGAYELRERSLLYAGMLERSWESLAKETPGRLETILTVDVPIGRELLRNIAMLATVGMSMALYVLVAWSIAPEVTLLMLLCGTLFFICFLPLGKKLRHLGRERAAAEKQVAHAISESLSGMKTIKALGAEAALLYRASAHFEALKHAIVRSGVLKSIALLSIQPLAVVFISLLFAATFRTDLLSMAAFVPMVYLVYRLFTYLQHAQTLLQVMQEQAPHVEAMLAYKEYTRGGREVSAGRQSFAFAHELAYERISFAYDGAAADALKDVSFVIPKGALVGIVGPSGSGKTTVVDLLLRLLAPTSGSITIDGTDIREINASAWRREVGYVSQDAFLIAGSVADNIRFYDASISDAAVADAATKAGCDAFLAALPEGLHSDIGERGVRLSGGERQRIALARVLARKPSILVLDEATSALDGETEARIQHTIEKLRGTVTIVMIAHRVSTVANADALLVFKNGMLAAQGKPGDILPQQREHAAA